MAQNSLSSFQSRCIHLAAGVPVNCQAYARHMHTLNLAKVKALSSGYQKGWLHNVMSRITPHTMRDANDYVLMASLFIEDENTAKFITARWQADITQFALQNGINYHAPESARYQKMLTPHLSLFDKMTDAFETSFNLAKPANPFTSQTWGEAKTSTADLHHIRTYLKKIA
ncbi:MAG: hypothetical protein COY40_02270 [Alphaproteobacteria bacterium CG_4_10_14_0_8_um_filter_53_9]|nr:MAG: hypothetical protein COY40_02270 [Alphaproteobacteria bacterium CG_4_10_14_0_8_um_filter_53_9]